MSTRPMMISSGMREPGTATNSTTRPTRNAMRIFVATPRLTSTDASSSGSFTGPLSFGSRSLVGLERDGRALARDPVGFENVGDLGNVPRAVVEHLGDHLRDRAPRDSPLEERRDCDLVRAAERRRRAATRAACRVRETEARERI